MKKLTYLKSALAGGASVLAMTAGASAAQYNIPSGDLKAALHAYSEQSGIALIASDEAVKGARTKGARGEFTALVALSRILAGTGFEMQRDESGAVAIVRAAVSHRDAAADTEIAAATPRPDAAAESVETVVVTSSKIKGDIQTVPIAITALSQEQLTSRQIAGGPDLVKEVPNLTFSKTNFTGYNLEIRGIGTQAVSVTIDPAVAVAFNDTPFLRNHFFEQEFYDLNQVEVLRGPQGTLFGRNANAGVVNIVSAKPTDQFEAMLSADWGNFNNRRYEGMVNLPIVGDKLDLRIAGEWTKRDGYAVNENTNSPIDGRDLWSSRVSLRWKPVEEVTADFIWEHFQEGDDRLRSSKQLCKTDPGPTQFIGSDGTIVHVAGPGNTVYTLSSPNFSQGCVADSLYDKGHPNANPPDYGSFGVPNGFSLPYITGAGFEGLVVLGANPYIDVKQSTNLRDIQSEVPPIYKANNDTLEFNAEWQIAPSLVFDSETGYNRDFLWSTEDYNRFNTAPGVIAYSGPNNSLGVTPDPDFPVGSPGHLAEAGGIFCDPQLGCSDRVVVQDLATEHSWQFNQEFRFTSNFRGPFNFAAGGNYLHYETVENYYVFSNILTMLSLNNVGCDTPQPYVNNVTDHLTCVNNGKANPHGLVGCTPTECPQYIDPNPITNLNDNGHNYFLSKNPYILNSYALFGEAYYNITPDLKLTTGIRWTDDQKHFPEFPSRLLTGGYGINQVGQVDQSWRKYSGRVVVNWTPKLDFTDQTMIYGSFAHGYKAGGANPPPAVVLANQGLQPVHPLTFNPEYIDAFELGTKNTGLDGALVFDADVFYYDYKGYQISQIVDRTSVNINVDATVRGAEIQTSWEPTPGLKFGFNGGYEDGVIKQNQFFVDLMDRTYGHHDTWTVMRPWAGEASNCVFPDYVAAALIITYPNSYGQGNPATQACGFAYGREKIDPVYAQPSWADTYAPSWYPGFDPSTAPNGGAGFSKPVGGNQLPNAPHFTTSLTADYTMPVSANWAATLHSDFYWQSQSWARIFNDPNYDKIRGYSNVNLALILTDATGWQAMAYVKNVFNVTAITGDFLNSDDTGLTTNLFLTDPRLYGVRVTKHFDENDLPEGGYSLFSNAGGNRPQIWLTVGGNFAMLQDDHQPYAPSFEPLMPAGLPDPLSLEKSPRAGFDWEGKLTYQPADSDWKLVAGIRYGRSSKNKFVHKSLAAPTRTHIMKYGYDIPCDKYAATYPSLQSICSQGYDRQFLDDHQHVGERHMILDFTLGKDVGLGSFASSTLSAGVRIADFTSRVISNVNADPVYNFPSDGSTKYHLDFESSGKQARSFHGVGPTVNWDGSAPLLGNPGEGQLSADFGLNAALLFGRQGMKEHFRTTECRVHGAGIAGCYYTATQSHSISRSRRVTVPNLGGYAGLSVRYNDAKISLGYRADEFFNAMDGGQATAKKYDRGFYGPYLNLSLGFGG